MIPLDFKSYLDSFLNFEIERSSSLLQKEPFRLDRIEKLLNLIGNPQKDLKIIHVAGTKGKGSTCAFLAYILAKSGCRVGLYTSPHLHEVNERIRILDLEILQSKKGDPFRVHAKPDRTSRLLIESAGASKARRQGAKT